MILTLVCWNTYIFLKCQYKNLNSKIFLLNCKFCWFIWNFPLNDDDDLKFHVDAYCPNFDYVLCLWVRPITSLRFVTWAFYLLLEIIYLGQTMMLLGEWNRVLGLHIMFFLSDAGPRLVTLQCNAEVRGALYSFFSIECYVWILMLLKWADVTFSIWCQ